MDYKLFEDFITLQALLKDLRIIRSGGAAKFFLAENIVLFNGQDEKRRGKKLRIGDNISLPEQNLIINLVQPSPEELAQHQEDEAEKERVAALVKKMNQKTAKKQKQGNSKGNQSAKGNSKKSVRKPVRFPGT
ncbi:S4 domain-containing protein YaaA [Streptococcus tangpeifui]|uniref:S4 domain-containing protein YaaA n=1 Tax=Streptococcus tangpeifui TaxID=2709400 RepID=UPI0013EBAF9B|nr:MULTISPECIES: S4 domain-containing protein YaaA [unclassified Streptococcus]